MSPTYIVAYDFGHYYESSYYKQSYKSYSSCSKVSDRSFIIFTIISDL